MHDSQQLHFTSMARLPIRHAVPWRAPLYSFGLRRAGAWLHASRPRGAQCGKKGEAMNPASLFFFYLLSSLIAYCSIRPTKKALYYILKGEKKPSTLLQVKRATRQSWDHDGSTAPPPDGSATNSEPRLNQTQQRPALQKQVTR